MIYIATHITALWARLKAAIQGIYLDRGIGAESIAMLVMMAAIAIMKGCK